MRFLSFSARGLGQDASWAMRRLRRQWLLPTLTVALGVGLGVWLATYVDEPAYVPLLARVTANAYRPFGVLLRYAAQLLVWLVVVYVSARFRRRFPYFLCCAFLGYVLGRIALFCIKYGMVGIMSLLCLELPLWLVGYLVGLVYFAHLADVLLCTLRPRFNRRVITFGLGCLAVGVAVLFGYAVVLWGLLAKVINVVS